MKFKKSSIGAGLLALGLTLSGPVPAAKTTRLEVHSYPVSPAAKVWIDGRPMETTPVSLPYCQPGIHVIRVSRQGAAIESRLFLKKNSEVILVADFLKNELRARNQQALDYQPLQGKTRIILTSTQFEPAPPEPSPVVAPEPAVRPEPAPAPEPETAVAPPPLTDTLEPEGWSPQPGPGEMGPPVPPELAQRSEAEETPEPETPDPGEAEQPAPPKEETRPERETIVSPRVEESDSPKEPEPAQPCPIRSGRSSCDAYQTGIRGTVYRYYCLLTNNDFKKAYELRITDNDLEWFIRISRSFCNIYDFRIRGFSIESSSDYEAVASYVVDLIDSRDRVLESWQMRTFLTRRGNKWGIKSTYGKQAYP